jgi:hypothetical protein
VPLDPADSTWARSGAIPNLGVSVGTADGTVADVGAAFNQATLNNNFRDLADKLNAVLQALRDANVIVS